MHDFKVVFLEDTTDNFATIECKPFKCYTQGVTSTEILDNGSITIDLYWETLRVKEIVEKLRKVNAFAR